MTGETVLETKSLGIQFGGLKAVNDVNIYINKGELVGLIGPNGAGKTTIFNLITGIYTPTSGSYSLMGKRMNGLKTHQVVNAGIARTFQNIRLFKKMTVLDNVKVAFNKNMKANLLQSLFRTPYFWKEEEEITKKAMDLLKLFHLEGFADQYAENLPYGKQRLLEIARALATDMKLLLLDEPAAGMNPVETAELKDSIKMLREKFGIPILLIEHDMSLVMSVCERIYVLNFGEILAHGTPEEISTNKQVIEAYLGSEDEDEGGEQYA
jgi:branched-chain amino acid transport system ATP-binding protein